MFSDQAWVSIAREKSSVDDRFVLPQHTYVRMRNESTSFVRDEIESKNAETPTIFDEETDATETEAPKVLDVDEPEATETTCVTYPGELGFVHIPKTAGSTIEKAARIQQMTMWGYRAWTGVPQRNILPPPNLLEVPPEEVGSDILWHIPPALLKARAGNISHLPYQGQDLFAIIRNPYARVVSEVFYKCGMRNSTLCLGDQRMVNQRIRNNLGQQLNCTRTITRGEDDLNTAVPASWNECYLRKAGHYIPQWHYFYNSDNLERQIRYLIHFESLHEGFAQLMTERSLDISLQLQKAERKTNYVDLPENAFRGVESLEPQTIRLIKKLYREDFQLGRYSLAVKDAHNGPLMDGDNPSATNGANRSFWELPCKMWW